MSANPVDLTLVYLYTVSPWNYNRYIIGPHYFSCAMWKRQILHVCMPLNEKMHPRNPYKDKPPDFNILADKFVEFRSHCYIGSNGKLKMNFRDTNAVRILARTLLLSDFGLDVEMPPDCLVPRIPQRLNYILFIDDLLKANGISENVLGIDIGTGASCVYPLLGAKLFGWKFLATDADPFAVEIASRNVETNDMGERIDVVRVPMDCMIKDVVRSHPEAEFTFCMCNPPFYEYEEFEEKFRYLKDNVLTNVGGGSDCSDRPEPHSATVARSNELAVTVEIIVQNLNHWYMTGLKAILLEYIAFQGGEVAFVSRLIEDSFVLQNTVKLYTSMVGKKSSLVELRKKLGRCLSVRSTVMTLYQGKTHRWVLAWTFEARIKLVKLMKCSPPLELYLPAVLEGKESSFAWIKKVLASLEVSCEKQDNSSFLCEAVKNTWSQQRQKRRAQRTSGIFPPMTKRYCLGRTDVGCTVNLGNGDGKDSYTNAGNFTECLIFAGTKKNSNTRDVSLQAYVPLDAKLQPLIRFRLVVYPSEHCLKLFWLEGSRHSLHQIWQFCRNQLAKLEKSVQPSSS
uniref:U6 small nuclear RNA (adenine-(43)-N(6))-methyltransferase n=1 Tax=Setaria digitata TaxID=48799 RepID=A0A915Q2K9_9BILA